MSKSREFIKEVKDLVPKRFSVSEREFSDLLDSLKDLVSEYDKGHITLQANTRAAGSMSTARLAVKRGKDILKERA